MPPEVLNPPDITNEVPETEPPATEPEVVIEQEPLRESIETVSELLDQWKVEYEQVGDSDQKRELAYRIVKLGEAVALSGLNATEIKIREAGPGVLGFYVPATGEVAITPAGLSLAPEHFGHVLKHEATHEGATLNKPIADEGLVEIITEPRVADRMHGIYPAEKKQVYKTFEKHDLTSIIDAYDFDNPRKLFEYYLEIEWRDEWKNTLAAEFADDPRIGTDEGRKEILADDLNNWVAGIDENVEKAVPRLFAQAKADGFDFNQAHQKFFTDLLTTSDLEHEP